MNRLFWKIFALFFVINGAVLGGGVWLANAINDTSQRDRMLNFPLLTVAENAVYAYESERLDDFLASLRSEKQVNAFLLDDRNRSLSRKRLPDRFKERLAELPVTTEQRLKTGGFFVFRALRVISAEGREYRFVLLSHRKAGRQQLPVVLAGLLLTALCITSLMATMLLTRRLRSLQTTIRELTGGKLASRVEAGIATRRDAVGDLGREFNRMAERIECLIESQHGLLRDVSHELRTPLARMQVAMTLLEDCEPQSAVQVARLRREADLLESRVAEILTLSRLESRVDDLNISVFNLHHLLEDIASDGEYEFAAQNKKITVSAGLHTHVVLSADIEQLHRAFENIIRNALFYTSDNSRVEISITDSAESLKVSVRDCGPGVSDAQLHKLFEPFFRIEPTAKERHQTASAVVTRGPSLPTETSSPYAAGNMTGELPGKGIGHGVGLAIARSVIVIHNGVIHASNIPGGGLEICVTLPRSPA